MKALRTTLRNPLLRIFVAGSIVSSAVVGIASPGDAAPVAKSASTGDCTPVAATHTRLVGADGTTVSSSAAAAIRDAAGTEFTYALPGGATMTTIVPPKGFLPQTAAPATARAFGFDAPDDPTALATWRARYSGYKQSIASTPCLGTTPFTTYSGNWDGYVASGHSNYVEVYDDQNIPTYSSDCGSTEPTSDSAPWIGFGGTDASRPLIQEGFVSGSSSSSLNGARLWYEYLNPSHQNPPVYIPGGSTTRTGDVISMYITYSSGTATFHWYDRTTSTGWNPATVSGLSSYYDGTTAEWINEWPNAAANLRKFSQQTFSAGGAEWGTTFADIFNLPLTHFQLTTNGSSSGAAMISDFGSSSSSFYQNWLRCH
jgi:hypothetical protein